MSFAWPLGLLALLVPVVLGALWWRGERRIDRDPTAPGAAIPFGTATDSTGRLPGRRRFIPPALLLAGLVALAIGLARPTMTVELPRVEGTVVFAIDNSASMTAEDGTPTRLADAQRIAHSFVDRRPSTVRVGVVSFSSAGATLQAPTGDDDRARVAIDRLVPGGSTAMGQGLFTALNAVVGEPIEITDEAREAQDLSLLDIGWHRDSVVVMISDGENTAAVDVRNVAALAANGGVRVFTVGVGTLEGAEITSDGFRLATARQDRALIEVAELTDGTWFGAGAEIDIDAVFDSIDQAITTRGEELEVTGLLGALAALLTLAGAGLSLRWFGTVLGP